MKEKFYITTAIPYASKKPHIGNVYEFILSDAIARFKKIQGLDVVFCTGTDEHGQKIEELAKKENIEPAKYAENICNIIKKIWENMNCSYDIFIRTTDSNHVDAVKQIFKKLYDKGDIYKDSYEGWYCTPCESFWTSSQLIDDKCPECNRDVQKTKESAYFLKVGKYQDRLIKHMTNNKDFIIPNFYTDELLNNFLKPGLKDFCVSRKNFKWGVSIDFDPEYVVYVWLDALINYITSLGFNLKNKNEKFEKYWPADLHVIGKDILRFHAIVWPIVLMMLDIPLPKHILVHQWLLNKENKMSKSIGNVIYSDDLTKFFSVDSVRYYVLKTMALEHDGSISYESITSTHNTDLANTIGNLIKRVFDMIHKYFDGIIPKADDQDENEIENLSKEAFNNYFNHMQKYDVNCGINDILNFAKNCNKYIDDVAPWVLAKDDGQLNKLKTVLYNLAEAIRFIAIMLLPITPETAEKILNNLKTSSRDFDSLKKFGKLKHDIKIEKPEILFKRFNIEEKLKEIENSQ